LRFFFFVVCGFRCHTINHLESETIVNKNPTKRILLVNVQ